MINVQTSLRRGQSVTFRKYVTHGSIGFCGYSPLWKCESHKGCKVSAPGCLIHPFAPLTASPTSKMANALTQVQDFLAHPSTPEVRAQFLASVPLEALVGLLGSGSKSTEEIVCQALVRLLGGDHADSRAFLMSPQGSQLIPAGLSHGSVLVRKTTIELLSSKTFDDEWVGWLRSQGFLLSLLKAVVDPIIHVHSPFWPLHGAVLTFCLIPGGHRCIRCSAQGGGDTDGTRRDLCREQGPAVAAV